MRKTKIICTLGPSTDKDGVLEELVKMCIRDRHYSTHTFQKRSPSSSEIHGRIRRSVIWRFDGRKYLTIQMRSDISFLYNLLIDVLLIYMLQSVSVNNDSVFFMFTTILISKT